MAKIAPIFMRKMFSMNPVEGKSLRSVTMRISKDGYKLRKGYTRKAETTPNGTKYEVYRSSLGNTGKLFLYFHGGGYVVGLSQLYRTLACDLATAIGGECVLLDYSIAPEFLYPTQRDQAFDLWNELTEKQGYKPENIYVGGDSAGGNLTMTFLLGLRDQGKPMPRCVVAISPWTDMTASGPNYVNHYNSDPMFGQKEDPLTPETRAELLKSEMYAWCGDAERTDPYVSPVYGDYKNFPPTIISVGGDEILWDDAMTIADNMEKNGVEVKRICHEKMFHIYPLFPVFPEGKDAFEQIIAFVKAH